MSLIVNQTNNIPVFVENQVLRADDLNALAAALQAQLQLNRLFNIGSGKIDGLAISVESGANAITLAEGLAISSDGYELAVGSTCTFSYGRLLTDGLSCKPPKEMSDACATRYRLLKDATKTGYELSEKHPLDPLTGNPQSGWEQLDSLFAQGIPEDEYCLLLIWCVSVTERTGCFNDCEARGADQSREIRVVLAPRGEYEGRFKKNKQSEEEGTTEVSEKEGTAEITIGVKKILKMCRFGFQSTGNSKKLDLCRIKDWEQMQQAFWAACNEARVRIQNAYADAYAEYYVTAYPDDPDNLPAARFTTQFANHLLRLIEAYRPGVADEPCPDIQYLYSYFQELILAYREFAIVADGLRITKRPDTPQDGPARCDFPGHVSLGWPGGLCEGSVGKLRTTIIKSSEREDRARCLFRRMAELIRPERLRLPIDRNQYSREKIHLTPDIRREPFLSSRAIPYYYNWDDKLPAELKAWHCDRNPYYLTSRYSPVAENPLLYRTEPYDFYRIEGHYGGEASEVIGRIEEIRTCLNVAFDVRKVYLGTPQLPAAFQAADLEAWYSNTRSDILCKLAEYGVEVPESVAGLRDFLTSRPKLVNYDLLEPTITGQCCEFTRPVLNNELSLNERQNLLVLNTVSSELVEFAKRYEEAAKLTLSIGGQPLPKLDTEMGVAIVKSVLQYYDRRFRTEFQMRFSCFAHAHPGLEHLSGVPKGGTLVLVCKRLPETKEEIIVADFCLPYLCCGDNIVVRNEIRKFTAEIELSIDEWCWTEDPEDRVDITVRVSPSGGTLRVIDTNSGNELLSVPVSGNSRVIGVGDFGNGAPQFENGVATLNFLYGLEGQGEVNALLTVYAKPTLDCRLAAEGGVRTAARFNESDCSLIGYEVTLQFAQPIELSGIRDLRFRHGTAADLQTIIIKADGVKPDETWLEDGRLARIVFPTETNLTEVTLAAANGPCKVEECKIPLSLCPDSADFELYERFELGKPEPSESIDIYGIGSQNVPVKEDGDTGFLAIKIADTGQRLQVTRINPADGSEGELLPKAFFYGRLAQPGECTDGARYFFVYNRQAALDYYASLATVPETSRPFTKAQLDDIESIDYLPGTEFKFEYFAALNGCDNALASVSLKIGGEKSGGTPADPESPSDGPDDSGNGGSPTPVDDNLIVVAVTPSLSAEAGQLLNRRKTSYRNTLMELRDTDNSIANSNGFKRTNLFLDARDPNLIDKAYMTALEATLKTRESTTAEREPLYTTVATVLTQAYLDKIVAIGDPVGAALTDGLQRLDQAGIDVKKIKRGWKAAELKKVIDKDRVEAVNKQIKA